MNTDTSRPITQAMDAIARYAERHGWIPIGWRTFTVGPWEVTVNGTRESHDGIPPYHARIVHRDIVAIMLVSPYSVTVGGWQDAEATFLRDIATALAAGTTQ